MELFIVGEKREKYVCEKNSSGLSARVVAGEFLIYLAQCVNPHWFLVGNVVQVLCSHANSGDNVSDTLEPDFVD